MKILFLHSWHSLVGGVKSTYLTNAGHEVINPALDDDDFDLAICKAQAEYDQHRPDVIVGSSRGGSVAVSINSGDTPLVLLCPGWKRWGTATYIKPNSVTIHSRQDEVIPFADSEELVANSDLPPETLIEVGNDHRLADPEPLQAMLEHVREFDEAARMTICEHTAIFFKEVEPPETASIPIASDNNSNQYDENRSIAR